MLGRTVLTRVPLLMVGLVLAAGCQRDLTHESASEALRSHFADIAPLYMPYDSTDIEVLDILSPSEFERTVRFKEIIGGDRAEGIDTTATLTANFVRSDQGWGLRSYGPKLVDYVAEFLFEDLRIRYQPELDVLLNIMWAYRAWEIDLIKQQTAALDIPFRLKTYERLTAQRDLGATTQQLQPILDSLGHTIPDAIGWGIQQSEHLKPVLWVTAANDTTILCARNLGNRQRVSASHPSWVGDDNEIFCHGRTDVTLRLYSTVDDLKTQITEAGNIFSR